MTDTYIRYTQEVFTNKYAMEAMMRNNQEVAAQNKEILFKIWFSEDVFGYR